MSDSTPGTAAPFVPRSRRAGEPVTSGITNSDGVCLVGSLPAVRDVLRSPDVAQAGFAAEAVRLSRRSKKLPVLYLDGPEHKRQRAAIARYFAPATVDRRYRDLMESRADQLVAVALSKGTFDLSSLALRYSTEVAAQVIGLTNSPVAPMCRRLEGFFEIDIPATGDAAGGRFARLAGTLRSTPAVLKTAVFFRKDVRPAIEARRVQRQEDVISHLLDEGYSDDEILIECLTYGAAGMVTTREFIAMCMWHLLEQPELAERYRRGEQAERYAMLDELLRLEPVVGHLFRRTTNELTVSDGQSETTVPAGTLVDLSLRAANTDERYAGDDPHGYCPGRTLDGFRAEAMSFGDGPHKCPGNAIAMQETDTMLRRLLAHDLELASRPRIQWDELISGYAVRDIHLRVR